MMTIARTANISLRHGPLTAVRDVSLELRGGEVLALIGPNGAGKSSLLKLLAGDIQPSAGHVEYCGRPLTEWSRAALARRRAVVPQDTHLDFAFTAFEVALMGRSPHLTRGYEKADDRKAAESALNRVQAGHLAGRLYPTLSGGERQRVQIARALAQIEGAAREEPRCLLLDEHTSCLDPAHQHAMFQLARDIAAEGVGVLAVVHDLNLAAAYADRIGIIADGGLVALGAPEAVLTPDIIGNVFGIACAFMRNPLDGTPAVATSPRRNPRPTQELRA